MDSFINETIIEKLTFTPLRLKSCLDQIKMEKKAKNTLNNIIKECKRLPASLNHHGNYDGGLYDHILLVTNFAFQIWKDFEILQEFSSFLRNNRLKISNSYYELDLSKILQTALCHDFGKIPYYAYKKKLSNRTIFTSRQLLKETSIEIQHKFNLEGKDSHVDQAIAVLKEYHLPFDDEISLGIIFHHGKWAKYTPFKANKLSELIHIADMIASQHYDI